jgi:hypothetical protein
VLTYHAFQDRQPDEDTIAGYLTVVLREIATRLATVVEDGLDDPTMDDKKIKSKATDQDLENAADQIDEAATLAEDALADEDRCSSAVKWRRLLGQTKNTDEPINVFPLPEYCNADGTTKSAQTVTRGSTTVPAGNDRYA